MNHTPRYRLSLHFRPRFWLHWWTPGWHAGRGPYISIAFGFLRFLRGY